MDSLQQLRALGQSIWLDYIRRDLLTSGELARMVEHDGVTGITSNPTIFAHALSSGELYDESIKRIVAADPELDTKSMFERIEVEDLQLAADVLRPVYERSSGADGFVSIEVSPYLAYETEQTIAEARRLWAEVDRKNLMVKVPATAEGIPAIEALTAEGINVNVTLTFSVAQYAKVARAYLHGIERNMQPGSIRSVASFFVSRVDTAVDRALEEIGSEEALRLRGKAALANAQLTYRAFRMIFSGSEFERQEARGVTLQKPLWASTSTKNKEYSDVMYVEGLIGPDTINSMPPETLKAFRDHGTARVTLGQDDEAAEEVQGRLLAMEINLRSIGQELTDQGVDKFKASYNEVMAALEKKRASILQLRAA
jgi:transaldolase